MTDGHNNGAKTPTETTANPDPESNPDTGPDAAVVTGAARSSAAQPTAAATHADVNPDAAPQTNADPAAQSVAGARVGTHADSTAAAFGSEHRASADPAAATHADSHAATTAASESLSHDTSQHPTAHLLRIGEVAELFGISTKTLRHYEKIGIFPPGLVASASGYRYYHVHQLSRLSTIVELRREGYPLEEIKHLLNQSDTAERLALLRRRQAELDREIARLERARATNGVLIQWVERALYHTPLETLRIDRCNAQAVWRFPPWADQARVIAQFPRLVAQYEREVPDAEGSNPDIVVYADDPAALISANPPSVGEASWHIGFLSPSASTGPRGFTIPAGRWASWAFRGAPSMFPEQFARLSNAVKTQGELLAGPIYAVQLIDSFINENADEWITEFHVLLEDR